MKRNRIIAMLLTSALTLGALTACMEYTPSSQAPAAPSQETIEEPSAEPAAAPSAESTPDSALQPGEKLFTGEAAFEQCDSFAVSFVLAADGKEIHSVEIAIVNLEMQVKQGITTSAMIMDNVGTSFSKQFPVIDGKATVSSGGVDLVVEINGDTAEGTISFATSVRLSSSSTANADLGTQPIVLSVTE
ncbi:MAG: hypothetical protein LBS19_02310 [Clostridiales bacterium]|jgi:hypothetical protein|nr:hypothetical protein [Clostridiales bacterium]